jgi:two-component system alkaline phosphatase synthesis response regulator PhoP
VHVLLVDDNPKGLEPLEARLKALGYRMTIAQNGEVAVSRFGQDRPSIVVLDVTMPEMNGYQACREMKRLDARVPIIILTAKSDPADRFWAFQSGADAFLNKPIDPNVIVQQMATLLRRP